MQKFRGNYSSCTSRNSENICSRAAVEALTGKRGSKQDETQFITKKLVHLWGSTPPPLKANVMYFFASFFCESHLVLDQTQDDSSAVFSWLYGKLYNLDSYPMQLSNLGYLPIGHFSWVSCTHYFVVEMVALMISFISLRESYF
jgi:hypothetical protein